MLRDILKLLYDARESARAAVEFSTGRNFLDYQASRLLRSAVEREFIVIGEALKQAVNLDPSLREAISKVREIVGFRNLLVHGTRA